MVERFDLAVLVSHHCEFRIEGRDGGTSPSSSLRIDAERAGCMPAGVLADDGLRVSVARVGPLVRGGAGFRPLLGSSSSSDWTIRGRMLSDPIRK